MEGRSRRGGSAHLITLIQEPICNRSTSAQSNHRRRISRPKSLFPVKIKPVGSEPTSPVVNCAGQVKERAVPDEKLPEVKLPQWPIVVERKQNMLSFLACSLKCVGFDSNIRCCGSLQGLPPRDCEEEEGEDDEVEDGSCDVGNVKDQSFNEAEVKDETLFNTAAPEGEDLVSQLPPGNALQLIRGKPAPANVEDGEVETDKTTKNPSFAFLYKFLIKS